MRAVDILVTAIGNSFRSRLRTTLTVIAIFIGAFTLTITNGLGTGINDYIDGQVASIGAPDVMTVTKPVEVRDETEGPAPYEEDGPAEIGSGTGGPPGATVLALTDDDLERIAQIDGIGSVEPLVAVRPDYIQAGDGGKFVLTVNPLGAGVRIDLAAGSLFDDGSDELQIIVPTTYVAPLGFDSNEDAVGAPVTIGVTNAVREQTTVTATIVGVQEPTLFGANPSLGEALAPAVFDAQNVGEPGRGDLAVRERDGTIRPPGERRRDRGDQGRPRGRRVFGQRPSPTRSARSSPSSTASSSCSTPSRLSRCSPPASASSTPC